ILPAIESSMPSDEPRTNPTLQLRTDEATTLWAWLADHYEYESLDGEDSSFYAAAARDCRDLSRAPEIAYPEIVGDSTAPELTAASPAITATLHIRLFTP